MNSTNTIEPREQMPLKSPSLSYDLPLKWMFLTNQSNMMYLLAHGLFLDFRDFGEKYFPDLLQFTPGYVPFFNKMLSQHDMKRVFKAKKTKIPLSIARRIWVMYRFPSS
jgi:hypothetical protein